MKLTATERKTILRSVLLLAPVLAYIWVWRPYRAALSDARDRLATEQDALRRELGAVATARRNPELQHLTDSVLHAMEPRLFDGRDDVVTTSQLAAYLGDVADQSHVWMQDASTRPATSTTPGVRTLHVEIRAESDFRGLLTYLHALEEGDKLVRIERLDVSHVLNSAGNENAETLSMSATIAGYAIGGTSSAAVTQRATPRVAAESQ